MAEQHSSNHPVLTILKESGAIIAFFTGLLFLWGFLLFAFVHVERRLPGEAFPDKTVPEYLVFGALVATFYFLPVVLIGSLVIFVIDKLIRGRVAKLWSGWSESGPVNPVVAIVVFLFILSVCSLVPIAQHVAKDMRSARVKSVTPSSSSKLIGTKYEGLIFVAKRGTIYIFVDKLDEDATVYLLNEAEVGEIIFSRTP